MKKLLLLPLIALMFMGCSKEALTDDPEMATQTVQSDDARPIKLVLSYGSGFESVSDNLTITYTGEDQESHSFGVSAGTYEFVATGGSLSFSGQLKYSGNAPYVEMKYRPDDESMNYSTMFTMPEEIYLTHGIPIGQPIFGDTYTVRVSFEEVF